MTPFGCAGADILQRFRDGERSALESVYRANVDSVAGVIAGVLRRYGGNESGSGWREIAVDLPDLVQEAFARAFAPEMRRRFDGVREYGPYIRQVARNLVIDYLRRRQRRMVRDIVALADESAADEQTADVRTMAIVGDYLAGLSPEMREVHGAMYVRGLSQREAAAALGLSRQVVRTLEQRLRQGLRSALEARERPDAASDVRRDPMLDAGFGRQPDTVTR